MAELLVLIADALAGKLGEDVEGYSETSWQVRFNNGLLAVGKFADIATDWVLVVQLGLGTFGDRPILYWATFACALAGTLVELYAVAVLFSIKFRQAAAQQVEQLKKVLLNRKLAWWRFGTDDFPTSPQECSAAGYSYEEGSAAGYGFIEACWNDTYHEMRDDHYQWDP